MFIPYEHKAHYYETDKMGVIHHSNFIRWFEEARTDYMDQMGVSYAMMEKYGIMSPVVSMHCEYKKPVKFNDTVVITIIVKQYTGVKLTVSYEVKDKLTGETRCTGESTHCFLTIDGKITSLKKANEEFHQEFMRVLGKNLYS